MSANMDPIPADAKILKTTLLVRDKAIVNFVNGIRVSEAHTNTQKQRSDFLPRLLDGITGEGAKRQQRINSTLIEGQEGIKTWLSDVTESQTMTQLAIKRTNESLIKLNEDVIDIADFSVETRDLLRDLQASVARRHNEFERRFEQIEIRQEANEQIDRLFSRWENGWYEGLPIASRFYVVLEELKWGTFGLLLMKTADRPDDLSETIVNRAASRMGEDLGISPNQRVAVTEWIQLREGELTLEYEKEALAFLADEYVEKPFVLATTERPDFERLPIEVPRFSTATRFARALASEVFEDD